MSKKKVMIGMSGGVDSSVAAALLLEQGYEVVGVTLKLWSEESDDLARPGGGCCSLDDINDARMVAFKLGIPALCAEFQRCLPQGCGGLFCQGVSGGQDAESPVSPATGASNSRAFWTRRWQWVSTLLQQATMQRL